MSGTGPPSYILLYVASVSASEAFYAGLLDRKPVEILSELYDIRAASIHIVWAFSLRAPDEEKLGRGPVSDHDIVVIGAAMDVALPALKRASFFARSTARHKYQLATVR